MFLTSSKCACGWDTLKNQIKNQIVSIEQLNTLRFTIKIGFDTAGNELDLIFKNFLPPRDSIFPYVSHPERAEENTIGRHGSRGSDEVHPTTLAEEAMRCLTA